MDTRLRFLDQTSLAEILSAFNRAFGDYALKMDDRDEAWLRNRMIKNAVDYGCSVGAFAGDELVGFSLTGVDDWRGEPGAYDAATGIVPDHRGKGLARRMFEHALPRLRERGVRRFVLEVLQENEPAIKAYRAVGFEVTREFDCYIWNPAETRIAEGRPAPAGVEIRPVDRSLVDDLAADLDFHPSWELSLAAVKRVPDEVIALGAFADGRPVGTLVYYPRMEWVLNLVVARDARRRGVGAALLRGLEAALPPETGTVKLINVERGAAGARAFVEAAGFAFEISQYEMEMAL